MDKRPALLVMAAGMGSRYGGLKQMDKIGPGGEIIIDYSLYDARRAGFDKAVFVINRKIEKDFRELIDGGAGKFMDVEYVFQDLDDIPEGFSVPEERVKPWGTAHAVYSARNVMDGPFAVINSDDYYGPGAFEVMYDFLKDARDGEKANYCMVSYLIENTLSESGSVARGVCGADEDGNLCSIVERTKIQRNNGVIQFTEDDGASWTDIPEGTPVSMNLFGFTESFMPALAGEFEEAMARIIRENPLKGEFFLPSVVEKLIKTGRADVKLLVTGEKWQGVTYREDRPKVVEAMAEKTAAGMYPERLWCSER